MKSICLMIVWFGKLPDYYYYWKRTALANKTIDFILLSDQVEDHKEGNITYIYSTLENEIQRYRLALGNVCKFESPSKLCDFKPLFGYLYQDLFTGYDFWGYCDIDLALGDLRKFISRKVLDNNERIYSLGHLNLYKNNEKMRMLFKESGSIYRLTDVLKDQRIYAFDEFLGMNLICQKNDVFWYKKIDYCDCSGRSNKIEFINQINYKKQLCYWEDGRAYVAGLSDSGQIINKEFSYIHWRKKLPALVDSQDSSLGFYITPFGIFDKQTPGKPSLYEIEEYGKSYTESKLRDSRIQNIRLIHKIIEFVKLPYNQKRYRFKELGYAVFGDNPPYSDYRSVVFPKPMVYYEE